jgi:MFS family permease
MFGVYQTFYQSDFLKSQSASQISWVGSVQAFLLFLGSAVAGPFFDMGYLRTLLSVGTFCTVFGMMMTSVCKTYWQVFLAQGIVVGIGYGCLFLPSVAIVSQYFTTRKSFAFGIASTGSSIGQSTSTCHASRLIADSTLRRRYLSDSLPSITASSRFRLGDAYDSLHNPCYDVCPAAWNANEDPFVN